MQECKQLLIDYICRQTRATVGLEELEQLFRGKPLEYEVFAGAVLELEREGSLEAVKAHGRNGKPLSLAYRYRVRKRTMQDEHIRSLHQWNARLHPALSLDAYYRLTPEVWEKDLPYLRQIDAYLQSNPWPSWEAPAPERSYELVRDEKWMTDGGGQALLERLGIWGKLRVIPVSDPLMLAVNPSVPMAPGLHLHLVVENKTTFQGLAAALPELPFSTLIYGCGRKIVGNLEMLRLQYPIPQAEHRIFYFGDLDREGILIWYDLQLRNQVRLALPYYQACLRQTPSKGKEHHRVHDAAVASFASCFPEEEAARIAAMLQEGYYIPQETLPGGELIRIGRTAAWSD